MNFQMKKKNILLSVFVIALLFSACSGNQEPSSLPVAETSTASASAAVSTPTAAPTAAPTVAPTTAPVISAESTPEPTSATEPASDGNAITLVSMTTPIERGEKATIKVKGQPDTKYSIEVYYSSGKSSASGLEDKVSDKDGYVSWTWRIGGNTKPGNYNININGNGETLKVEFTVQ